MVNKDEILEYYHKLCLLSKKSLTREQYRGMNPKFSSSLIEKLWGNWKSFALASYSYSKNLVKEEFYIPNCVSQSKIIIVSSVFSGESYDESAFELLKGMASHLNADLRLLYINTSKKKKFTEQQLDELEPYLVQDLSFTQDKHCICKSIDLKSSCKKPLTNVEKISHGYNLIVISSAKQQCKILPYDTANETFKVAYSTGTISKFDYKNTINGYIDREYNKCGAVVLEYDETKSRFLPRNIEIVNNEIYDKGNVFYFDNTGDVRVKKTNIDALVLGDLHLPEAEWTSVAESITQIRAYKPKHVLIGDWCSFNSINHHEANKYLDKVRNGQQPLEKELDECITQLNQFVSMTENCEFLIIHSNHDEFLDKWLNSGEMIKDKENSVIGCELFSCLSRHENPYFYHELDSRIRFLKKGENFSLHGVVLSNHGHVGLCGTRGNSNTYVRTYQKSVTGHTHSPKIEDSNYTVGTCSRLNLSYTDHLSNWAFANAFVHENGTVQLIF